MLSYSTQLTSGKLTTALVNALRAILPFSGSCILVTLITQPLSGSMTINQPLLDSFSEPSFRGSPPRLGAGGASAHLVAIFS